MSRYGISIREILKRTVIVNADSLEEAIQKAEAAVEREEIILDVDDYDDREIVPSEYWEGGKVPDEEDVSYYWILSENTCISLKELYENGYKHLKFGGKIELQIEGENQFYDLYKNDAEHNLLLCDGENVEILQELPESILVENPDTNCKIKFTPEEFEIATFK